MSRHIAGLWKHPDFRKLWIGQTISEFGSRITREGLPLTAILFLNASPDQIGTLVAISSIPVLLFGLIAGAWVDRLRRRPIMMLMDFLRFGLLLLVPLAALTGLLSFGLILSVAAFHSILTMIFNVAYHAYLPALLTDEQLLEGNAKIATTESLAEIGGPPLAGVLIQVIGAPLAIFFDALSFLISAISLNLIKTAEPAPTTNHKSENIRGDILNGMRFIRTTPLLFTLAVGGTVTSFFGNFIGVLYSLYLLRTLELSPGWLGFIVAFGGIGSLIGAVLTQRLTQRFGIMRTLAVTLALRGMVGLLLPTAGGTLWQVVGLMVALQLVGDAAMSISQITELSVRQSITPDAMLGRVNATIAFMQQGIAPIGGLAGGWLAVMLDVRTTLFIAMLGILLTSLWVAANLLQLNKQKVAME